MEKYSPYRKKHGMLTVGELKKMLDGIDEDTVVVTSGSDHSYMDVGARSVGVVKAEYIKDSHFFSEHYDDCQMDSRSVVVDVLLIGE